MHFAALPGSDFGHLALVVVDALVETLAAKTPISISTMFNQLACSERYWNSSRCTTRRTSLAGKAW